MSYLRVWVLNLLSTTSPWMFSKRTTKKKKEERDVLHRSLSGEKKCKVICCTDMKAFVITIMQNCSRCTLWCSVCYSGNTSVLESTVLFHPQANAFFSNKQEACFPVKQAQILMGTSDCSYSNCLPCITRCGHISSLRLKRVVASVCVWIFILCICLTAVWIHG